MADRNGYIGRAPGDSAVTVARQTFSPTGVTTDFTFASGYTVGYLDLFLNRIGIQSSGTLIGNAETLNFVGTGNTFALNGSTIDVSISSGAASIMTIGVRVGTAVTFTIPSTNTLGVVGRSATVNVPV